MSAPTKKCFRLSGEMDLLTYGGIGEMYDKYTHPYVAPINEPNKMKIDIPDLYDSFISNIKGHVRIQPGTTLRELVFSGSNSNYQTLPSIPRQSIARAFRISPGSVSGIDTSLLTWDRKKVEILEVEDREPTFGKKNKLSEKEWGSGYLYDTLHHKNKKQRVIVS